MNKSVKILSNITVFSKYAKFVPVKNRRETWEELCYRNRDMHLEKYPSLHAEIINVYNDYVIPKKVLPSMRSMQFAGKPIKIANNRIFNCAYLPIDDYRSFSELMFLLLGGSGVGYSVQKCHIEKLPEINKPTKKRRYLVGDSIEGWADAVKALFKAYMKGGSEPVFDFSDIREKGAPLITSGGKAPGPAPLEMCLFKLKTVLNEVKSGESLSSLQVHDICCYIADSVLAGGVRRSSLISFFDIDDNDMLTCKFGSWWELNPQRARANNSAVILRHKVKKKDFMSIWEKVKASNSGEPGIYFTNDKNILSNPCCFTGDTPLLTESGYKTFKELDSIDNLKLINHKGEVHSGKVWSTGIKEVITIKNSLKEIIKCTKDHVFMLNDGSSVQAKDVKRKRLMPLIVLNNKVDMYTKLGYIQGDAGLNRLNSESHKGLEVYFGNNDSDVADIFNVDFSVNKKSYYINGYNDILQELRFVAKQLPERSMPETFNYWNDEQKKSFLKGMFSANGCIVKNTRVSYKTTCNILVKQLRDILLTFGIKSYITKNKAKLNKFNNGTYLCKESYDLNISDYNSIKLFAKEIAFIQTYKNNDVTSILINNSPVIMNITEAGSELVYDFNIDDDTHWGVVGKGYIAHNCEISLKPNQFCNLCEVNVSDVTSQEDLNNRSKAAAFLGTLQAGYTDFHYLRDIWKRTTEKDSLLGIGMTGIASGEVLKLDMSEAANIIIEENKRVASLIGVNPAARTTCVKPSGTSSLVLGCSSGIHAWHSPYYIRRMRVGKNEAIYNYLAKNHPDLVKDDFFNSAQQAVIEIPIAAPEGAVFRTEPAIDLLERIKKVSTDWIKPGHVKGDNTHNVSATVSIKDDEWDKVGEWMWNNREFYNGLSVLPNDGGTYKQAPFEEITKEKYEELLSKLEEVDLSKVIEMNDNTDLSGEVACAGGLCEVV